MQRSAPINSRASFEQRLARIAATPRPSPKPKVYFEEWDDPLISGIGWVSELIEIAGGEDALPKLRFQQAAKDRIIAPDVVREAAPDVILASWCGKKVVPDRIRQRPGWSDIPAVRNNRIVEIKSPIILQPGPAALTDGLDAIVKALWREQRVNSPPSLRAQRSNPPLRIRASMDCFVALLLAMTVERARLTTTPSPPRTIPR